MSYDQFDPSSHGQDAATREQVATPPDGSASVPPNADDSGTSVGDPARAMGGDLTVRSTVGVGTTLTLSLERA